MQKIMPRKAPKIIIIKSSYGEEYVKKDPRHQKVSCFSARHHHSLGQTIKNKSAINGPALLK